MIKKYPKQAITIAQPITTTGPLNRKPPTSYHSATVQLPYKAILNTHSHSSEKAGKGEATLKDEKLP